MLRLVSCTIILIFISQSAFSEEGSEPFQPITTPQARAFLSQFQKSVPESLIRLRIENIGCSGTAISTEGHVLTALHCIRNCLIKSGALNSKPGHPAVFIDKAKAYSYSNCFNDADGPPQGIKIDYIPAAGWIFLAEWMQSPKKKQIEFIQTGLNADGLPLDFAVIRILSNNYRNCIKANPQPYLEGEVAWSISYPLVAEGAPQLTIGKFLKLDLNENMSTASVDAETGSSGSGILDIYGQIRGITVRVDKRGFTYQHGTAKFISMTNIISRIRNDIGDHKTNLQFNCP